MVKISLFCSLGIFMLTTFFPGGYTYLTIASFVLCSQHSSIPRSDEVLRWLVGRQLAPTPPPPSEEEEESEEEESNAEEEEEAVKLPQAGFQGRVNKPTDACYSFWCTAGLHVSCSLQLQLQAE